AVIIPHASPFFFSFFFSSRRRHTSFSRDWSSDVCSSDLFCQGIQAASPVDSFVQPVPGDMPGYEDPVIMAGGTFIQGSSIELSRSEERRVGKECSVRCCVSD